MTPKYHKDYYKKNKENIKHRTWKNEIKRKYGIDSIEYDRMLSCQNNICAICLGSLKSNRRLCVDHDHLTGKIRGLLCGRCNRSMGQLNEDVVILSRMIDYLLRHKKV